MKIITVQTNLPIRLDRYLRKFYPNLTQGIMERHMRFGNIKFNGSKAKSSMRVINNDKIYLYGQDFEQEKNNVKTQPKYCANTISLAKKILSDYLVFSSSKLIIINKPASIAVQGGSKIKFSIDDAISYINHEKNKNFKLVHRLDKETSGLLIIANGSDNATLLGDAFKKNSIRKTYYAILDGFPKKPEGTLINNIGKDKSGIFETVKELDTGGKIAETKYKIIQQFDEFCLVKFHPKTGRMHQLRFHSKYLGTPILGDTKYGGRKHNRMMLHAKNIVIPKDIFGNQISIDIDLPEEFNNIMNIKKSSKPH